MKTISDIFAILLMATLSEEENEKENQEETEQGKEKQTAEPLTT